MTVYHRCQKEIDKNHLKQYTKKIYKENYKERNRDKRKKGEKKEKRDQKFYLKKMNIFYSITKWKIMK